MTTLNHPWRGHDWRLATRAVVYFLLTLRVVAAEPSREQVALAIYGVGNERAASVVELLHTRVPSAGVVLVDREEVSRALKEQNLLGSLAESDGAVALGKMLKCDVFASLFCPDNQDTGDEVMSLVLFDAKTGVRLYDQGIKVEGDLDAMAGRVMAVLEAALSTDSKKTRTNVSLASIRAMNFNLPSGYEGSVRMLLERALLQHTGVAVLERTRLDRINREAGLTEDQRRSLLSSTVMISIELLQDSASNVTAKVTLSSGSATLGVVALKNVHSNPAILAEALSQSIVEKMGGAEANQSPPASAFEEAQVFWAQKGFYETRGRDGDVAVARATTEALVAKSLMTEELSPAFRSFAFDVLNQAIGLRGGHPESYDEILTMIEQTVTLLDQPGGIPKDFYIPEDYLYKLAFFGREFGHESGDRHARMAVVRATWARLMREFLPKTRLWVLANNRNVRCLFECAATNVDELLDEVEKRGPFETGYDLYIWKGPETGNDARWVHPRGWIYDPDDFSADQKRRLLSIYEHRISLDGEYAQNAMTWAACAIAMAYQYRDVFTNSEDIIRRNMRLGVECAWKAGGYNPRKFLREVSSPDWEWVGVPQPEDKRVPLPERMTTMMTQETVSFLRGKYEAGTLDIDNLMFLDRLDGHNANPPGCYLTAAAKLIMSDTFDDVPPNVSRDDYVAGRLANLKDQYQKRYDQESSVFSGLTSESGKISIPARATCERLVSVGKGERLVAIREEGSQIYMVASGPDGLELYRFEAGAQSAVKVGAYPSNVTYTGRSVLNVNIGKTGVHVPTDKGVVTFGYKHGAAEKIGRQEGLPLDYVTDVVEAKNRLFIGMKEDESFFVTYDLEAKAATVLGCSGTKEERSVLDNCRPYSIDHMFYHEAADRLFFTMMFDADHAWQEPRLGTYFISGNTPNIVDLEDQDSIGKPFLRWPRRQTDGTVLVCVNSKGVTGSLANRPPDTCAMWSDSGYAIWDPSTCSGAPFDVFTDFIRPLLGCPYKTWSNECFVPRYRTPAIKSPYDPHYPPMGSLFAVLDDRHAVSADKDGFWGIVPREDAPDQTVFELPKLDGETPMYVVVLDGTIHAATSRALWKVNVRDVSVVASEASP